MLHSKILVFGAAISVLSGIAALILGSAVAPTSVVVAAPALTAPYIDCACEDTTSLTIDCSCSFTVTSYTTSDAACSPFPAYAPIGNECKAKVVGSYSAACGGGGTVSIEIGALCGRESTGNASCPSASGSGLTMRVVCGTCTEAE